MHTSRRVQLSLLGLGRSDEANLEHVLVAVVLFLVSRWRSWAFFLLLTSIGIMGQRRIA
jgi:hypothetical protein